MMKKYLIKCFMLLIVVAGMTACQKDFDERFHLEDQFIEFEDAVTTTVAVGKNYPVLTRTLSATNGSVSLQINMSGLQSGADQPLAWKVVTEESTAVEGRDFRASLNGNSVELKANSSKTNLVLEALPATGQGSTLVVLELVGNDMIKPMEKYKRVGIRCIY
jgi:hypothetical protein